MLLLATAAMAVAQLFVMSLRGVRDARDETVAALLAVQKIEQLQGAEPGAPALSSSPPESLEVDVGGYVDDIDATGRVVRDIGEGAVFLRRWNVQPLSGAGTTAVVIRVRVLPLARAGRRDVATPRARAAGEALVTTVRAWR